MTDIIATIEEVSINSVIEELTINSTIAEVKYSGDLPGAMQRAVYDSDNDHIVDNADNALKLGGKPASDYIKNYDVIDCGTF